MGRAPCCDKANVKRGPWSPEEDDKLKSYIEANGTGGNWIALPQKIGLKRCGKSCRLRWLNYLRPNLKHGGFSEEEDNIICSLYISIGSRWSIIAAQLPGRTDNDIKNYWNTRLKKKLLGRQRKQQQQTAARRSSATSTTCFNKQEMMKRESDDQNYLVPEMVSTQEGYWPQLAAVMPQISSTNQDQDQESIRNLLIKLGGRFCHDDDHPQSRYPLDVSFAGDQFYDQNSMLSSTSNSISISISPINSTTCSQVTNNSTHFNVNEAAAGGGSGPYNYMFQGIDDTDFTADQLSELIYSNNHHQQQQILDGLQQSFYGTVNTSTTGTSSVESSSWGDINSLAYPQIVSGFEANNCQLQSMPAVPPVSIFDETSYFGPQ